MAKTATGDALRAWRKRRGLNQRELGDLVGVRPQSVSAWEAGEYEPRPEVVRALDEALEAGGAVAALYNPVDPESDVAGLSRRVVGLEGRVEQLEAIRDALAPVILENAQELASLHDRIADLARDMQRLVDPAPHGIGPMPDFAP